MKVSLAQVKSSTDKQQNLEKAERYIKQAKESGSDFIVLPEMFMAYVPADSATKPADIAEPLDGPFVSKLKQYAKTNQIYVIFGTYESDSNSNEFAYNTIICLDRSGELLQAYRKTHLYDAFNYKESETIKPGTKSAEVIETEFGKIGIMVCYEIRFPEISRKLVIEGADFIFVPTGWVAGNMKEDHWQTILRARAIENTVYMFGANQVNNMFTGCSMIVDPMGLVIASAGEEETLITTPIDIDRIKRVRSKLPSVKDRRPEFYKIE